MPDITITALELPAALQGTVHGKYLCRNTVTPTFDGEEDYGFADVWSVADSLDALSNPLFSASPKDSFGAQTFVCTNPALHDFYAAPKVVGKPLD